MPVENTLESIEKAFESGAAYVEIDAVSSKDGSIFILHNVVPRDHFFGEEKPKDLLNKMNFSDIQSFKTGRYQKGDLVQLETVLNRITEISPKTCDWDVNIEIKGVQGSGQDFEINSFIETIAEVVKKSNLSPKRVLFSSFAMENIIRMSHFLPEAHYGMLFSEDGLDNQKITHPIYQNHQEDIEYNYIPFDIHHVDIVKKTWSDQTHTQAQLNYLHPEITSITEEMIVHAARHDFGINSWGLFEKLDDQRKAYYQNIAKLCRENNVFFSAITDYVPEMVEFSQKLKS